MSWAAGVVGHGLELSRGCFSSAPAIEASRVENVLVPCAYSPTYVVKDFPIARYQGLQFVSVSSRWGQHHAPLGDMAKPNALPPPQGRDVSTWLKSRRKCPSLEDGAKLPHLDPTGFALKAVGCLRCWGSPCCWDAMLVALGPQLLALLAPASLE